MTEQFDIIDIGRCPEVYSEQMGSKDKFWIEYGEEYWLYKVPRPHTGEHWAERVVADIALILGIPAALVELAERDGSRGTISKSFL